MPYKHLRPLNRIVFTERAVVPQADSNDAFDNFWDIVGVGRRHEEGAVRAPRRCPSVFIRDDTGV